MPTGRCHRTVAMLLALLLVTPSVLLSQQKAQEKPQQDQPIRVQVQLVNLFATVRDDKRRLVPDLAREEVRVFEDGQEQKVEFFQRQTDLPLTIGLLIDTSISQENTLNIEQEAATRFFQRVLQPKDLAMVMSFDVDVTLLTGFTNDVDRLERAIGRAHINAPYSPINPGPLPPGLQSGGTNMFDAIYLACTDQLAREAGRKALIVITDADDTGSKIPLKEAVEVAQRTDTVIHIILIADTRNYRKDSGTARKFADETGGRVIEPRDEQRLSEAFDQIVEELRSQYTIGYTPTNAQRDGSYRKVKLEATRKGIKVLTRKGYYAPKG